MNSMPSGPSQGKLTLLSSRCKIAIDFLCLICIEVVEQSVVPPISGTDSKSCPFLKEVTSMVKVANQEDIIEIDAKKEKENLTEGNHFV